MSSYIATVIKTGNSYALRVPKNYVENSNIKLGQKVKITPPLLNNEYDVKRVKLAIRKLQEDGAYGGIDNPVAWQRQIRKDRALPGRN
jgi:hypothetical protein